MAQVFGALRPEGLTPPLVFQCAGFVLDRVAADVLHTLDLGVSQGCFRNLLCEFWSSLFAIKRNRLDNVRLLLFVIKEYYTASRPLHKSAA